MRKTVHTVKKEAMALSPSERASLAHDLILSLDDPAGNTLAPEQEAEIARRARAVRQGRAVGRSAADVFSAIKPKTRSR
ncbi:MAG: addiction module protein [Planctomycetes bacterium]|nr:addiction module protein [Planctomycetota bacterium]